jgi:chromosome segregation ATPase
LVRRELRGDLGGNVEFFASPASTGPATALLVEYFSPCLHELSRILKRVNCRAQIALAQRNLANAEEHLGLLGWQQADFDESTQRQVDSLQNIEREQAVLTNRSADQARQLAKLSENRVKFRTEYDQSRSVIEAERQKARHPLAEFERKLNVARAHAPDVDRKAAQLDREQRDIEELSTKLLVVQPQPIHIRDEILRLRDRALAIQNERNDLRTQYARSLSEIHHLEQQTVTIEKRVAEFDQNLRELRAKFEQEDHKLADEERACAEEKEKIERQVNDLEHAKGNPYQAIGRVLADNGIAPMNQPAALSRVLDLRERIAQREATLASLHAQTHAMDRTQFRVSIVLWLLIIVALVLIIGAMF